MQAETTCHLHIERSEPEVDYNTGPSSFLCITGSLIVFFFLDLSIQIKGIYSKAELLFAHSPRCLWKTLFSIIPSVSD